MGFPLSRSLVAVAAIGLTTVFATPRAAEAQTVVIDVPDAEFLTTVSPIYFENHAVFWWHGHWVWRDGNAWHRYDHEPPFLANHRMHDPPNRWFYGTDAHGEGAWGHDVHGGHGAHEEGGHEGGHEGGGHEGHKK